MKIIISIPCIFIFLSLNFACNQKNTPGQTLHRAVEWMWEQQSTDGGWHSKTHAVLSDGKVLTPYILFHLLRLDTQYHHQASINKAVDFMLDQMHDAVDDSTSTLSDYPNYSAAYALRVLHLTNRDTALQNIIGQYLLHQQFIEHRGFDSTHLAYGGWGYGETGLPYAQHGHVDISHTRKITEALHETGFLNSDTITGAIKIFLKGVQRVKDDHRLYEGCIDRSHIPYDGGFIASVVTMSTIKSKPIFMEEAGYHYPSYATATCDGFMAMDALGLKGSKTYEDAGKWLIEHQAIDSIDGLSTDDPGQWGEVMHYYHLAVRAEAMKIILPDGDWKQKITSLLIKDQQPEGYFVNPIGGVNKEDDPLMATTFAIQALSEILGMR